LTDRLEDPEGLDDLLNSPSITSQSRKRQMMEISASDDDDDEMQDASHIAAESNSLDISTSQTNQDRSAATRLKRPRTQPEVNV
jgi:hypothetical protein